jgi:hypothetical protein
LRCIIGLDQNACATKGKKIENDGEVVDEEQINLAYWRKHSSLQGWMEDLYRANGGEGEFNCVEVELDREDLESLQDFVTRGDLPKTEGFFFGSGNDERYKEQDLTFVKEALELVDAGYTIRYSSWW